MNETDCEKAERWCKLANDRLGEVHDQRRQLAEMDKALEQKDEAVHRLAIQRDGLLDLIALAMKQEGAQE